MNKEKLYELLGFVLASKYRKNVLIFLGDKKRMPSDIAKEIGVRTNHISNVLKDLKEKELIVCINPNVRKGRLYELTDMGKKVLEELE